MCLSAALVTNGPYLPFAGRSGAAVQLPQNSHSSVEQHFIFIFLAESSVSGQSSNSLHAHQWQLSAAGANPIADERIASVFDAKEKVAIVCDSVSQRSIISPNEKLKAHFHD
jgi:hypothetical protein